MKLKFTLAFTLVLVSLVGVQAQTLWGVTSSGVSDNKGVIFTTGPDGSSYTQKYPFNSDSPGSRPFASPALASGMLYGMTLTGGSSDAGIIYELNPSTGAYTKKFDFGGSLGVNPQGGLMLASDGLLYGMTTAGGASGAGILFSYSPGATSITKKFDFGGTNGSAPTGTLVQASNGLLYGVTTAGGTGDGVLFEFNPTSSAFSVKHSFSSSADGSGPSSNLVEAPNGKLYGVAPSGGSATYGTLFEFDPAGPTFAKKVDFNGSSNGFAPYGSLTLDALHGIFLGMTSGKPLGGGSHEKGTIFTYSPGSTSVITKIDLAPAGGYAPQSNMIFCTTDGFFYGMMYNGGANNVGVIFRYDGITFYQNVFDFDADVSGGNPMGALVEVSGQLYGAATYSGPAGNGTLFQFDQSTLTFTKKVDLSNASAGSNPQSGLTLAGNGMLYGTAFGGTSGNGVIYEVNPSTGAYTKKFDFNASATGSYPSGALTLAPNGKLYGTTTAGGTNGDGIIFEYDPGTTAITVKFNFSSGTSGSAPMGALCAASDGLLYGTTSSGGAGAGILFSFDPASGTVTNKYVFTGSGVNGMNPQGGVIQAANGKLYGMTNQGGTFGSGALFEWNVATSTFTKLFDMSGTFGSYPGGELLQGSNGKLYGLASNGGANSAGVIFEYDYLPATPTFTVKHDFDGPNGSAPLGSLIEVASGVLVGYTSAGGSFNYGTVFNYNFNSTAFAVKVHLDGNASAPGALPKFGALLQVPAKQSQTITFGTIPNHAVNDVFTLGATVSSPLTVTYSSSNPSIASVSGNTVTVHTPGTVNITASQLGNANYTFAQNVVQPLTIAKASQTISFTLATPVTYSVGGTITLNGTASSGLAVTYISSDVSVATITGNTLSILKAAPGGITITAQQAGDGSYDPATDVPLPLVINKANQSISFAPPATPQTYGAPFTITVTGTSGLPISFSSSPSIVTVSGTGPTYNVTIIGPSNQSTTITASQPGNGNYNAAPDAQGVVFINKATQTMTFGPLTAKTFGDAPFTLTGTSTSGLSLSYASSDPTVASISGSTVTILKGGSTQITPSQPGDGNYLPASPIGPPNFQVLTINKANQTITFGPLPVKSNTDLPFTLSATASSGLTVSYGSSNTGVATVSGNTVTIVGVGSTDITATQAGSVNYNAAPQVIQTLVVTTKQSQSITFNTLPSAKFGTGPVLLTASASSGLPVSYVSGNTSVATVSGNTVTIVGVGTSTITASQAGDATYNSALPVNQDLVVTKGDQTITFQIAANPVVGGTFALTGTATSGLPVTYQVITVGAASISGTTVTALVAGSTTIRASQAGTANYNAAADVDATFCIRPVQPTITVSGNVLTSSSATGNVWLLNGLAISGATTQTITATKSGSYTVQVITGGCTSDASLPAVYTGDLDKPVTSFMVYPNPAKDRIIVDLHEFLRGPVEVKIIDQKGQSLHFEKVTGGDAVEIGISEHASGLYILLAAQGERILKARYVKGQ